MRWQVFCPAQSSFRTCRTRRSTRAPRHIKLWRVATQVFQYHDRVTYAQCTVGDHVYYARYLDFLEAARGEFFRQLGLAFLQLQQRDVIFPVIECRLRYKSPARYDDVLTISVWPSATQGVRLNFGYRITNQNHALVLEAETVHVCTGLNERPKRLPVELIEKLAPYLAARPQL